MLLLSYLILLYDVSLVVGKRQSLEDLGLPQRYNEEELKQMDM